MVIEYLNFFLLNIIAQAIQILQVLHEVAYFYKSVDSDEINYLKIKSKETIFTPAKEIHSCYFPVFTSMVVSSGFPRDQKTYEEDTVRISLVNHTNITEMLEKYGKQ